MHDNYKNTNQYITGKKKTNLRIPCLRTIKVTKK